ncbi:hypothetical protein [Pseudomonas putida]|uniref:hypothetical protein n=1 Tax=Pseudomonas putida TaxID=303 RepID=UPI000373B832|nr:hypothetical protein [Pseudomonas putida]ANC82827.1 hypothetical protein KKK_18185 [Pseudomonas putida B6-2]
MKSYCMAALVIGMFSGFHSVGQAATEPVRPGTIQLAENMETGLPSGKQCTVVGVAGMPAAYKMSDTNCKNDTISYFKFNNVPSTTTVTFKSDGCNDSEYDWRFVVKTTKQPTTTGWMSIEELNAHREGDPVTAGLELIKHVYNHGNIRGKLSCVVIRVPAGEVGPSARK